MVRCDRPFPLSECCLGRFGSPPQLGARLILREKLGLLPHLALAEPADWLRQNWDRASG